MVQNPRKILIIAAPSGSGKTTIMSALLRQFDQLQFSISATTRKPRGKEVHGKDYYFLSLEAFREKIAAGAFLEYEEVYPGKIYGTLKSELERIWDAGKSVIFDVDVEGAMSIRNHYPNQSISIFIKAPSLEILRERLIKRGTDSPEEINQRVNKAESELAYASRFDHLINNDHLETAIAQTATLIETFLATP